MDVLCFLSFLRLLALGESPLHLFSRILFLELEMYL